MLKSHYIRLLHSPIKIPNTQIHSTHLPMFTGQLNPSPSQVIAWKGVSMGFSGKHQCYMCRRNRILSLFASHLTKWFETLPESTAWILSKQPDEISNQDHDIKWFDMFILSKSYQIIFRTHPEWLSISLPQSSHIFHGFPGEGPRPSLPISSIVISKWDHRPRSNLARISTMAA